MSRVRRCDDRDFASIHSIINAAAQAYRGVIPADRWHEPYMSDIDLRREISAGVEFWGHEIDDQLVGVMGTQRVRDVELIRHAYVLPAYQRHGVGRVLIQHIVSRRDRRMLVGTWADAAWAIAFYQRHGFELVSSSEQRRALLQTYWTIPDRQIETSAVLELRTSSAWGT